MGPRRCRWGRRRCRNRFPPLRRLHRHLGLLERRQSLNPGPCHRPLHHLGQPPRRGALLPRCRPPLLTSLIYSLPPLMFVLVLLEGHVGGVALGDRVDPVGVGVVDELAIRVPRRVGLGVGGGVSLASPAPPRRCLRRPLPPIAMLWVVILVALLVGAAERWVVRHGGEGF
jgi:hypothetical protein